MLRYIGMYYLMGLVLITGWAIGVSCWLMTKCGAWMNSEQCKLVSKASRVFLMEYRKDIERLRVKKNKMPYLLWVLISYTLWPINIATGLSRVPDVTAFINAEKERA